MVGSICGEAGAAGQIPYSATKSAFNGLVLPMARDLGFLGIRAMTICPGTIPTQITDNYLEDVGVPLEARQPLLDSMAE